MRAADPELVHLHLQAAAVTGAFLVPWFEGVTLRPCQVVVRVDHTVVQDARFAYTEDGRLGAVTVDGKLEGVQRDAIGRLDNAYGYQYQWEAERLVQLVQRHADGRITHALAYDERGALIRIQSQRYERGAADDASPVHTRHHSLRYDERGLLSERRWTDSTGAHAESYYTYDGGARLVRVDVDSTDAAGRRTRHPSLLLEYQGDRLIEFGRSVLEYDAQARIATVTTEQGARAEYGYRCP